MIYCQFIYFQLKVKFSEHGFDEIKIVFSLLLIYLLVPS